MGDPDGSVSEKPQIEYIETCSERPKVIVIDATPLSAEHYKQTLRLNNKLQ